MKKLVIYACLALLVAVAVLPTFATATTTEQQICDIVMQHPNIKKAKCIVYERNCIVAIQAEKFTNKTEYCSFVSDMETQIKEQCQIDNVKITRNPKVMSKIDTFDKLDDTTKQEQIKELIEYFLNKPTPLPMYPAKPPMCR